jgi:hypothetical protein
VLDLLKYVFLAVLYIFVARAVKAVYLELRPAGARPRPRGRGAPAPPAGGGGAGRRGPPRRAPRRPPPLIQLRLGGKPLSLRILLPQGEKAMSPSPPIPLSPRHIR